jgi:hypothetical protein
MTTVPTELCVRPPFHACTPAEEHSQNSLPESQVNWSQCLRSERPHARVTKPTDCPSEVQDMWCARYKAIIRSSFQVTQDKKKS